MNWFRNYLIGPLLFYLSLLTAKPKNPDAQKRWPPRFILGHRGARSDAPENTLSSFDLAMKSGADGVEFDVFLSKDGIPVVIHDDTVDRTTDGEGFVSDLTAEELEKLDATKLMPDFKKEGVPTLMDTLDALPDGAVANVELKDSGRYEKQIFISKLTHIIERHKDRLTIIISSFDGELLAKFRKANSNYLMALLLSARDKNWPSSLVYLNDISPEFLNLPPKLATTSIIKLARWRQFHVAIWTVNDPHEAKEWFDKGVDGIFTDKVATMITALRRET